MKAGNRKRCLKRIGMVVVLIMLTITMPSLKTAAGDNLSTASPFVMGNTLTGSVESKKDSYYQFTLSENSCIKLCAKTNSHDLSVSVSLHDSTGEELDFFYTNDDKNWGYQSGSRNYGLNAGTYYLKVYTLDSRRVDYTLETSVTVPNSSAVKVAGQNNRYLDMAVPFEIGNQLRSVATPVYVMGGWEKCHCYRFTLNSAASVRFDMSCPYEDGYGDMSIRLYDSQGKEIKRLGFLKENEKNADSITVPLQPGTYYVGVTASMGRIPYTIVTSGDASVKKVAGVKVSSPAKGKLKIKWKKVSGSGYEVCYSRNKNFKNGKKKDISNASKMSFTKKGLKRGKVYYVRVRAYKLINSSKSYGSWSAVKKVRVKK